MLITYTKWVVRNGEILINIKLPFMGEHILFVKYTVMDIIVFIIVCGLF